MKLEKQYAVFHIKKGQGTDSAVSAHIERTIEPTNVDSTRTNLNKQLIAYPDEVANRSQAIQHLIKNAGIKRKISKDQVQVLRCILTGSHEQMKELENTGRLDKWVDDNLRWLKDTFGEQNVVSAHLHLDEKTPHIHASVVPIVTGERRKADKNKKQKTTKNTIRLCADDVMTRTNLKNLQDTYAETMSKFGLERGIVGSETKHISTQEYYRNIFLELERLREEQLISAEQLKDIKHQVAKAKSEKQVEELKNSLSKFGTNVSERLGSFFDSSGRKQRDEKNSELENQLAEQKTKNAEMLIKHNNEIDELNTEQARILGLHNSWRKMVEDTIPLFWERLRIAEVLKKVLKLSKEMTGEILDFKTIWIRGKLYNPDANQCYDIEKFKVQMMQTEDNPEKLELRFNDVEHNQWFKQKTEEEKIAHWERVEKLRQQIPQKKVGGGIKVG